MCPLNLFTLLNLLPLHMLPVFAFLIFFYVIPCVPYSKVKIVVGKHDPAYFRYDGLCHPETCVDGSCYCSDRTDGWFNSGAFCSKNMRSCPCFCDGFGTTCTDKRCPDGWNVERVMKDSNLVGYACYYDDPVNGRIYSNRESKDFCFKKKIL